METREGALDNESEEYHVYQLREVGHPPYSIPVCGDNATVNTALFMAWTQSVLAFNDPRYLQTSIHDVPGFRNFCRPGRLTCWITKANSMSWVDSIPVRISHGTRWATDWLTVVLTGDPRPSLFTPHRSAARREAACSVIHGRGEELELFFETGFRDGVANQR
jgi:hypothetical protein